MSATAFTSLDGSALAAFHEARGLDVWTTLGAWPDPLGGYRFALWAPRALHVWIKGDFNDWSGLELQRQGSIFVGRVDNAQIGQLYKFVVQGSDGSVVERADPFAFSTEVRPGTASRLTLPKGQHQWNDRQWLSERGQRDVVAGPMSIYELHLGSWIRHADGRVYGYREVAERLIAHVTELGFSHVEFLPLNEYPYDPSWGYQVTGYFAPTSRFGSPDDLRYLIDRLHQAGVGVIMDWVPAHFPKDAHALARFDGEALFEYADPLLAEHPDWGTLVFDYVRPEVRSFLLASVGHWVESFHVDGIRVDAVASMLYLDYSRQEGQWRPNSLGGRENLDAISFLQDMNRVIRSSFPGVVTIAEESTAFARVTGEPPAPFCAHDAGLGFSLKWNMGWMHDTLSHLAREPIHRRWHHHELTFSSSYAQSERFVLPLSHDEVVHGKGSLVAKSGGAWQEGLDQLRLLYALQWLSPGKKLLFMGGEFGQDSEWDHDRELQWAQAGEPGRLGLQRWLTALNHLYRQHPALCSSDHCDEGFAWVDADDIARGVYSWRRRGNGAELLVVVSASDQSHRGYVIPVQRSGSWQVILRSDEARFGAGQKAIDLSVMPSGRHGDIEQGVLFDLAPYAVWVLEYVPS